MVAAAVVVEWWCSGHFGGAYAVRMEREKPDLRIGEIKYFCPEYFPVTGNDFRRRWEGGGRRPDSRERGEKDFRERESSVCVVLC